MADKIGNITIKYMNIGEKFLPVEEIDPIKCTNPLNHIYYEIIDEKKKGKKRQPTTFNEFDFDYGQKKIEEPEKPEVE